MLKTDLVNVAEALILLKGDDGGGSFRGGDPELLQQKKEEKRQEMLDQGDPGDSGVADEPDPADVEEAQRIDQEKKESAGKSIGTGLMTAGQTVVPVDKTDDYYPRNNNGDSWYDMNQAPYPDIKICPTRQGANQWKPWSEVVGFKIPAEGAPWQHIRRFILNKESPEVISREVNLLARSLPEDSDEEAEKAFFEGWDNLNRGLFFSPTHQIYKSGTEVNPAQPKYVHRVATEGGKWNYSYTHVPHENHGFQHSGHLQGSTMNVHPDWHSQKQDSNLTNPEGAFHYSRAKALETPAEHHVHVLNPDTMKHEHKIIQIKPGKAMPIEIYKVGPKNEKLKTPQRVASPAGLDKYIRNNHVHTEHDIHGNPWVQWRHPSSRTEKDATHLNMRYHPDSPYKGHIPEKNDNGWFQGSVSTASLTNRLKRERHLQHIISGEVPHASTFPENPETPYTNMLHQGMPKHVLPVPTRGLTRIRVRNLPRVKWDSERDELKFKEGLRKEHEGLAKHTAMKLLDAGNKLRAERGRKPIAGKEYERRREELISGPYGVALDNAVHSYDPARGARFSTHLHNSLLGEQRKLMNEYVRKESKHKDGEEPASYGEVPITSENEDRITAAHRSLPAREESRSEEWIPYARNHIDAAYARWVHNNPKAPDEESANMFEDFNDVHHALNKMASNKVDNEGNPFTPEHYNALLHGNNMHPMFHLPEAETGKAEEASNRMRRASQGHTVVSKAIEILNKAEEQQSSAPDATYLGKHPVTNQHLYEAGPGGNIVTGTNAPEDHEDHNPEFGSPEVHPNEPNLNTNPDLFDESGRKLDRPIPRGAEVENNPNYDPDKSKGNFWVKKFKDPESGEDNYAYLHRDQLLDPKMKNNLAIKYLDVQLPKIRQWYDSLLKSEKLSQKALGLFVALLDQGKMSIPNLSTLKVSNVDFSTGNTVTFKCDDGSVAKVVLDWELLQVLHSLLEGKESTDLVFTTDGQQLAVPVVVKFLQDKFGITPDSFRIYGFTLAFVKEFQRLIDSKGGSEDLESIGKIQEQAINNVAKEFGTDEEEIISLIDSITSQAIMLAASASGSSVSKSNKVFKSIILVISSNLTDKTPEEESFSRWLHSYVLHDHEKHWGALTRHASSTEEPRISTNMGASASIRKPNMHLTPGSDTGMSLGSSDEIPTA
jgi:hypothetical protein